MNGITYKNTHTKIPHWVDTLHIQQTRGYAYETDSHFVHLYGKDGGFNTISIGLTTLQKKSGTLTEWVEEIFGAQDIRPLDLEVGHAIDGVWRPALYYYEDTYQALNVTQIEMRLAEQALKLLVERLDEIFLYVEPINNGLNIFGHKTRELLILACTEVENNWKTYLVKAGALPENSRNFTTRDYVKLVDKLFLKDYEFKLKNYPSLPIISPFDAWNSASPTQSLTWYDAYNKTKHDRNTHFAQATLNHCISSVVANLILHSTKFSPFTMTEGSSPFISFITQHFSISVKIKPQTHYIPLINIKPDTREDLFVFDPRKKDGWVLPYTTDALIL